MIDMIVGLRSDPYLIVPVTMLGLVDYSRYGVRFIETIDSTRYLLNLDIEIYEKLQFLRIHLKFFFVGFIIQ